MLHPAKIFIACLALFLLTVAYLSAQKGSNLQQLKEYREGELLELIGTIVTEPVVSGKSQRFTISDKNNYFEVYTNQFPTFSYGEKIKLKGKNKLTNEKQDKLKKLSGKLFYPQIKSLGKETESLSASQNLRIKLIKLKNKLSENINKNLPEPASGLVNGVLFGTKAGLSDRLIGLLIASGTIHIIALSGYNITLVVHFFRNISKGLPRLLSFLLPIIGILLFVAATAFSASVVRAAIMGIFLLLANFYGRQDEPLVAILLSASLMTLENPYILLYDIGFQLSFTAFIGLIYLTPVLKPLFAGLGMNAAENISSSLAATLTTIPILSFNFERFSIIAPLANVFILPFVPLLMALGIILALLGLISDYLAKLFALIPWLLAEYFFRAFKLFGELAISQIAYKINSPLLLIGYYFLGFELLILLRKKLWKKKGFSTAL